jgi:hypothetical protein
MPARVLAEKGANSFKDGAGGATASLEAVAAQTEVQFDLRTNHHYSLPVCQETVSQCYKSLGCHAERKRSICFSKRLGKSRFFGCASELTI